MEKIKIRKPAVAGQFYPSHKSDIEKLIRRFLDKNIVKRDTIACIVPHAGYIYSGNVASNTVASANLKKNIILLGPNHTGYGTSFSIITKGIWETPLGNVKINQPLAKAILDNSQLLEDDDLGHTYEHSLEVELPILQFFKADFEMVPISILSDNITKIKELGAKIAETIHEQNLKDSVTLIASTDMTHYEPEKVAREKDFVAIEAILNLDEDKLANEIRRLNITMCGYAPTIAVIAASKALGAKSAQLIKYQTSGDTTQDRDSVVGYAGIIIS